MGINLEIAIRGLVLGFSGVVDPASRGRNLEQSQYQDRHKQEPRQRAAIAHIKTAERGLIEVQRIEISGIGWAACCGHKGKAKDLQATNDAKDKIEQDGGRDNGDGDMPN